LLRWQRAAARHVDAQFMNAIIQGLNCSPFEAKASRVINRILVRLPCDPPIRLDFEPKTLYNGTQWLYEVACH